MDEYVSIQEDGDYRQQQELEEERQQKIMRSLDRVASGVSTHRDARLLAAECGIDWKPKTKAEPVKKALEKDKNTGKKRLADLTAHQWFILVRTGGIYQYRKPGKRITCRTWVSPIRDVTLDGEETVIVIDQPKLPH